MQRLMILVSALVLATTIQVPAQYIWQKVFTPDLNRHEILSIVENRLSGQLYAGGGNHGVHMSKDKGATWVPINLNLPAHSGARLATDPSSNWIYAVIVGGGLWRMRSGDAAWERIDAPDVDISPSLSLAVTAKGSILLKVLIPERDTRIYRSTDNGDSWTRLGPALKSNTNYGRFGMNPHNGNIFVGDIEGSIYCSKDDGINWQLLRVDNQFANHVSAWAFSPDGGIFAGSNGKIFHSPDAGISWNTVYEDKNFDLAFFYGMAANAQGHIIACQRGGDNALIRSIDRGSTWVDISGAGLSVSGDGLSVLINRDGYVLYVSTEGIFRTQTPTEPKTKGKASLSGRIVQDHNADCLLDDVDIPLKARVVKITPGPMYTFSDRAGGYKLLLAAGEYKLQMRPDALWTAGCENSGASFTVMLSESEQRRDLNFLIKPTRLMQALRFSIASGLARPGFEFSYSIAYENVGTVPFSGTIKLDYDPALINPRSDPEYDRFFHPTMEWDLQSLPLGASGRIDVRFTLPRTVTPGSNLCSRVSYGNNPDLTQYAAMDYAYQDEICTEVTGSYDPNDIQVFPRGAGEQGYIGPKDSLLSYLIRFQNTGNDTAFTVVIRDTLSKHLNLTTLRFGAASHDYEVKIARDGALAFHFNKIMLPDSGANEAGSHGYIRYSVELKSDLAYGTQIPNRAAIYFDFNKPVITNTVRNTLQSPVDVPVMLDPALLAVRPNPVADKLIVHSELLPGARIAVISLLGGEIFSRRHRGGTVTALELKHLPPGLYMLIVDTAEGRLVKQLIVAK